MTEDFTLLPLGQARFLLKIIENSNNMAVAEGKSEGGSAKELHIKGYITPFGRVGRRIRWKLAKPLSKNEIDFLKALVK